MPNLNSVKKKEYILTGVEIGDHLELLEAYTEYPCSDGSSIYTVDVENLLKAQLRKLIGELERRIKYRGMGQVSILFDDIDWTKLLQESEPEAGTRNGWQATHRQHFWTRT